VIFFVVDRLLLSLLSTSVTLIYRLADVDINIDLPSFSVDNFSATEAVYAAGGMTKICIASAIDTIHLITSSKLTEKLITWQRWRAMREINIKRSKVKVV